MSAPRSTNLNEDDRLSLVELIEHIVLDKLESLMTAMPGVVDSYDPLTQKVKVQPAITSRSNGSKVHRKWPPIPCTPCVFPSGTADTGETFVQCWPLKRGDKGTIIWSMKSISAWLKLGDSGEAIPPVVDHWHQISDAIFIPGLHTFSSPRQAPALYPQDLYIGKDDGTSHVRIEPDGTIHITGGKIVVESDDVRINSDGASERLVRKGEFDSAMATLKGVYAGHKHTGVQTGVGTSGTPDTPLGGGWPGVSGTPKILTE